MHLLPWEYLFESFSEDLFPDIWMPTWVASLVMLAVLIALYNVRTRQLHRHRIYLDMYEWLLWTGITVFGLIPIYALFRFDFIIVLSTLAIGLGVMIWTRFVRFPPFFQAYERQLAKQRYFSRQRFARPEATIRSKSSRRRRRR